MNTALTILVLFGILLITLGAGMLGVIAEEAEREASHLCPGCKRITWTAGLCPLCRP